MFRILRKLLSLLSYGERKRGLIVLGMVSVLALLEIAGVASVMPFLAVLGSPELVETHPVLNRLYTGGGFASTDSFLLVLGIGALGLIIVSAAFRIAATYVVNRYTQMRRYSIGARLLQVYLRQPYEFFLDRNSADLSKSILSEVDTLVQKVFKPALDLIAYGLVLLALIALLVVVDPILAIVVTAIVGGGYALVYLSLHSALGRMGRDRVLANRERFQAASEAFGGIKDLKVLGREQVYIRRFKGPAARFAKYHALSSTLSAAPKYLVEAIGFGGVLALALTLTRSYDDVGVIMALLGLYAFAGYRLLPAAQHIYASVSALRFGLPAVEEVHKDLSRNTTVPRPKNVAPLTFANRIRLAGVTFRYPGAECDALVNLSFDIPAGAAVGLVGQTGAGKTTTVDLLLGLLSPSRGQIWIDDIQLTMDNIANWQCMVGYVPQTIYLSDASVSENIAFGFDGDRVDQQAVENAARIAQIHDFIVGELPRGYDTEIGERGVRLSGGQRQRLGIARALYHDPAVLVMDEATSALDSATEREIMRSVDRLSGNKTIITISHRLSTVQQHDCIVLLKQGGIVGTGRYEDLLRENAEFQKLAVASS